MVQTYTDYPKKAFIKCNLNHEIFFIIYCKVIKCQADCTKYKICAWKRKKIDAKEVIFLFHAHILVGYIIWPKFAFVNVTDANF